MNVCNINRKLKAAVIEAAGTQLAFAEKIGWDRRKLSKVITGTKRLYSVSEFKDIGNGLNLTAGEVIDKYFVK